ncbi:MAG: GNAT family N-acetyltransferase [Cellvibrionales bacterium]|jgi:ribosomal protein S18 acetylase RimI-like enzyme|nr:GNAT family N-acetyltransferase [Cellvibrionales bacterium]
MEISIRDATAADAEFLAWVILTAARGHLDKPSVWERVFSGPEQERMGLLAKLVIAEPRCIAHYEGFVIAEHKGAPIAAACGYIPAERTPEDFTSALLYVVEEAGWNHQQQVDLLAGFGVFSRCLPMGYEREWVLEYIATKPEFRGLGVTHELLKDLLECGREAGVEKARVAYFIGNEAAKKSYRKLGFKEVNEMVDSEFEAQYGVPGVVHMSLNL